VDDYESDHRGGSPIIEDPDRMREDVEAVGVDETPFLCATGRHPTWFVTGITDLTPGRPAWLLDIEHGRSGTVLANELITNLRSCPIPEIAKLGRTLHAWRTELLAHFDHPKVSNGSTENLNLKIKTPSGSPATTATSNIIDYDSCSTTGASRKITHRHGSEPAVSASLRRAAILRRLCINDASRSRPNRAEDARCMCATLSIATS
jgi:hypothetical protein